MGYVTVSLVHLYAIVDAGGRGLIHWGRLAVRQSSLALARLLDAVEALNVAFQLS